MPKLLEEQTGFSDEMRGVPSANHVITLLLKPLVDSEGFQEIWRRHSLALVKIIEQNEALLAASPSSPTQL